MPLRLVYVIALVSVLAPIGAHASATSQSSGAADEAPYVLTTPGHGGAPFGLLYTPELLAHILADDRGRSAAPHVADAVRRDAAIVVAWTVPPLRGSPIEGPVPRPYRMAILDYQAGT